MEGTSSGGGSPVKKRRGSRVAVSIQGVNHDILCMIFALLDIFDLVRCSAVCKSWNEVIDKYKLLQILYHKLQGGSMVPSSKSCFSERSLKACIEQLAMEHHRLSFQGLTDIEQWKGHSIRLHVNHFSNLPIRAGKCRMKMGLILTGGGDKVMRLWSLESYKCLEEHFLPDLAPLVDFDFDENKIVGLVRNRMCIWRRNGKRSIFRSREGTIVNGLCMSYIDPEAVVGCEDGTARVFDMYSKQCSRIIRVNSGPVRCLALSDDQCVITGSSLGNITISGLSSGQQIARLRSTDNAVIRTLCFNPCSQLLFAGSSAGYAFCWDLRTMRTLWRNRISRDVYSMQHLSGDTSTIAAGGTDGVLRILDQNTGEVVAAYVMEDSPAGPALTSSRKTGTVVERKKGRRITEHTHIDSIPSRCRPPISCLAVGMQKVVTTNNGKYIKMWKFRKEQTSGGFNVRNLMFVYINI